MLYMQVPLWFDKGYYGAIEALVVSLIIPAIVEEVYARVTGLSGTNCILVDKMIDQWSNTQG